MGYQGYHFCQELEQELGQQIEIVGMRTNMGTMTAPCDGFDLRLLKKKILHGGHPVLRWMANNVTLKKDATGKKKMPIKTNEQAKIDGIITLLMCLDGAMRDPEDLEISFTADEILIG